MQKGFDNYTETLFNFIESVKDYSDQRARGHLIIK